MAVTWQYIAGFFDGEGSIRIAVGTKAGAGNPQLALHQSGARGRRLLLVIQDFLKQHDIISHLGNRPSIPNRQPMYRLYIYNRRGVFAFIAKVFPFLYIKKVECQDIVRFLTIFPTSRGNLLFRRPLVRTQFCKRGHRRTPENLYPNATCKPCALDRANARYKARTAEGLRVVGAPDTFSRRVKIHPEVGKWL